MMHDDEQTTDFTDLDFLIDRIASGEADAGDLEALSQEAHLDGSIWNRMADALRTGSSLREAGEACATISDRIELPASPSAHHVRSQRAALARIGSWAGWAVAAMIGLAFVSASPWSSSARNAALRSSDSPDAAPAVQLSADDAWTAYLAARRDEGAVLNELPMLTVQAVAAEDGSHVDVVYVRRVMEHARLDRDQVFRVASDEHGRPVSVPAGDLVPSRRNSL